MEHPSLEERVQKSDLLDELLSNCCAAQQLEEGKEIFEYRIELHCMMAIIIAESLYWDEAANSARYKILDVQWEAI